MDIKKGMEFIDYNEIKTVKEVTTANGKTYIKLELKDNQKFNEIIELSRFEDIMKKQDIYKEKLDKRLKHEKKRKEHEYQCKLVDDYNEKYNQFYGFFKGKKPMVAGREKKSLEVLVRYSEGVMQRKFYIENRVLDGHHRADIGHTYEFNGKIKKVNRIINTKTNRYVECTKVECMYFDYLNSLEVKDFSMRLKEYSV